MYRASHVLLLNASPDESDMYAVWLASCGYRVSVARDLASARRVVRRDTVNVLVIDALFGASSRRAEFERRWTRLTNGEALGIVVLSGYLTDAYRPVRHGARKVCLFKPCLPQQLSRCIDRLLDSAPRHPTIAADKGKHVPGCPPS